MFDILFTLLNLNKKDERYNVDKHVEEVLKKYDKNGDKKLTQQEFVNGIKDDEILRKLLLEHKLE